MWKIVAAGGRTHTTSRLYLVCTWYVFNLESGSTQADAGQRRRAQNRASQRAFRERKEKHAQDLQKQLDELAEKHSELQVSYDRLSRQNEELQKELNLLKGETCLSCGQSRCSCDEAVSSVELDGVRLDGLEISR